MTYTNALVILRPRDLGVDIPDDSILHNGERGAVSAMAVLPGLRGCRTPLTLYAPEGNC